MKSLRELNEPRLEIAELKVYLEWVDSRFRFWGNNREMKIAALLGVGPLLQSYRRGTLRGFGDPKVHGPMKLQQLRRGCICGRCLGLPKFVASQLGSLTAQIEAITVAGIPFVTAIVHQRVLVQTDRHR